MVLAPPSQSNAASVYQREPDTMNTTQTATSQPQRATYAALGKPVSFLYYGRSTTPAELGTVVVAETVPVGLALRSVATGEVVASFGHAMKFWGSLELPEAPFTPGDRVVRRNDPLGTVGTVQRNSLYGVQGEPTWAVAVLTDEDGEVWSGTQESPSEGAWLLAETAVAEGLRPEAELVAAMVAEDTAHDAAELEASTQAVEAELVQLPTLGNLRSAVERRDSWCAFPECIHHLKPRAAVSA